MEDQVVTTVEAVEGLRFVQVPLDTGDARPRQQITKFIILLAT